MYLMKTTNTAPAMMTTTIASDETGFVVLVNDELVARCDRGYAETVLAARIEQGWRVWRVIRDTDGRLLDALLTIRI